VKKEEVWFWTNDLEIFGGEVYNWIKQSIHDPGVANIRSYSYFSIHLPLERLYKTEAEAIVALRDYKLSEIINS
jgi:hypothetical protein